MDIEKELGMRVKFLRVRKGWTQDQLAKKLGYTSRAMVSKIEKGERGIKASMVPLIADVFDVSVPSDEEKKITEMEENVKGIVYQS